MQQGEFGARQYVNIHIFDELLFLDFKINRCFSTGEIPFDDLIVNIKLYCATLRLCTLSGNPES